MGRMEYKNIQTNETEISLSVYSKNKTDEVHLVARPVAGGSFIDELRQLESALAVTFEKNALRYEDLVFARFFLSDAANQNEVLSDLHNLCSALSKHAAVSVVQQPSLQASKLVLWLYFVKRDKQDAAEKVKLNDSMLLYSHNGYKHIWNTQLHSDKKDADSAIQTQQIFSAFQDVLHRNSLTIKENCIRTWIYVKDVDFNYQGVVTARKQFFEQLGMTENTHYISSTGIEGRQADACRNVLMDAYSIGGIDAKQIRFLQALENLNPTHQYGVTFERGTSVDFGDRRHIYISGTASINNKGEVVYPKQIDKQLERTFENIAALLKDADADMADVAQMIVYLRDIADAELVNRLLEIRFPQIPKALVLAPVCRPEWLIEIECIAIKDITTDEFNCF